MFQHPKILVGVITAQPYAYCLDAFCASLKGIDYRHFDALFVDNSVGDDYLNVIKTKGYMVVKGPHTESVKERLVNSRNILRDYFLKHDYDYFFSVEQDVIVPSHVLTTLVAHNKQIVSGVYFKLIDATLTKGGRAVKKTKALMPLLYDFAPKEIKNKMRWMNYKDVQGDKLILIKACGLGCVLIHRDVLEKIAFTVRKQESGFDDVWFCEEALNKGFTLYADTGIKCKHLTSQKGKRLF